LNDLWEFNPSMNVWAWMGGSSTLPTRCAGSSTVTCGQPGVYGPQGTPLAHNIPGGRFGTSYWTDSNGNFWLYGGEGFDSSGNLGELNDLWEFNTLTKLWTWVAGSSTVGSNGGQSGIYGTLGTPSAANIPGGRDSAVNWVDKNGNLWLYGGEGFDGRGNFGQLNDLWEFNPSANEWVWVSGNNTLPALCTSNGGNNGYCGWLAVYGALGLPATGINPGSRVAASSWTDNDGNLWLFGGYTNVLAANTNFSFIGQNDLWEFNPSDKEWAWMSGSSTAACGQSSSENWCSQDGVFGAMGVPAIENVPTSRSNASSWTDVSGNFWLFGGVQGFTTNSSGAGTCNDVTVYNPSSNEWAWMNGSISQGFAPGPYYGENCSGAWAAGSWGAVETPAPGNSPSGRFGAASWTDHNGNFWVFGGNGWDWGELWSGDLNDLWIYQPPVTPVPTPSFKLIASPNPISVGAIGASASATTKGTTTINVIVAGGFDSPVTLTAATNTIAGVTAITGNLSPSTITGAGSSQLTVSVDGAAFQTMTGSYPITITGASANMSQSVQVIVVVRDATQIVAPTFSVPSGTYSSAQTVTINDSGLFPIIYYTTDGTTPTLNSPEYVNPITVSSTATLKAMAMGPDDAPSSVTSATYYFNLPGQDFSVASSSSSISATAGKSATTTVSITPVGGFGSPVRFDCSGLPTGALCSFSPASVTPPGTVSTTLTVTTSATSAALHRNSLPWLPGSALAAALWRLGWKRRRRLHMIALLAVSMVGLGLLTSCGGGGSGSGSSGGSGGSTRQPVTSTVTVTGTSGSLSHSTTFTLMVN
jgi:N-acetylneuraminic acid mutarotase